MADLIMIAALVYVSCAYLALVTFTLLPPNLVRIGVSDADRNVALVLSALWPMTVVVLVTTASIQLGYWATGRIKRAWRCEK